MLSYGCHRILPEVCICTDWRQTDAAAPKFYHGCMSGFVGLCHLLSSHAYENGRNFHNSQTQSIITAPKSARKSNQKFEFYTRIPDNLYAQCEDLLTDTSHKQSVNTGFRIYGLTMFAALTCESSIAMETGLRYGHQKNSKVETKGLTKE